MKDKIEKALDYHFQNHRLIFWYDDGGKGHEIYTSYSPGEDVIKLELDRNEFHLKYKLLKEFPDKKALIYSSSVKPRDTENWLLDLNLSNFIFASDESSLYLQELDLPDTFLPLVQEHLSFFDNNTNRRSPLKQIIQPKTETEDSLRIAMMSVLCGSNKVEREKQKRFPEIALNVFLDSFLEKEPTVWEKLEKYNLQRYFWEQSTSEFGYKEETLSLEKLLYHMLSNTLLYQLGKSESSYTQEIFTIVDNWRKHQDYSSSVQRLLDFEEKELNIHHELEKIESLLDLSRVDLYKEADKQLFGRLLEGILADSIESSVAMQLIEKRRESYWYKTGKSERLIFHYKTLYHYLRFRERLSLFKADFHTTREGWDSYTNEYYELDGDYRRFLYASSESDSPSIFATLLDKLENEYTESYLQPLADIWQRALDADPGISNLSNRKMGDFFKQHIEPYLMKDRNVFVIISDGLRYEIGVELAGLLEQKNRFQVEISDLLAPTPSYTQLGMASLLPHNTLELGNDGDKVLCDGMSTSGLENRQQVIQNWLDSNYPEKTVKAMRAGKFTDMSRAAQNDFIRGVDLIFLYSSGVDAVGDKPDTESDLPKAAADEIRKLENLCSHIGKNLSRTHIVITADHGFLYRYREVPDTERAKIDTDSTEIRRDHRFILVPEPKEHPAADILANEDLTWTGNFKAQIARGVTRFRRQGGGTRYVHGGRMLQELCVPVLTIKKTRQDDVNSVDVVVFDRTNRITTSQITVVFLQQEPVEIKRPARELELVFRSEDHIEISNKIRLIFDSKDPNDQNRSRRETFIFTKESEKYNGKMVNLEMYEIKAGGVPIFYKKYTYHFQKKIQIDIDF